MLRRRSDQSAQQKWNHKQWTLVQTPKRNDQAAGHRLRIFWCRDKKHCRFKLRQLVNPRDESLHQNLLQTIHDVDDGFEDKTATYEEFLLPREDSLSQKG